MDQSLNTNEARIKTRRTRRDRKSHSRRRQSEGDESLPFGHRRRSDDSTEFHQDPHYRKASSGIATAGKKGWLTSRNFSSSPAGRLLLGPREICSYFWYARHLRASFRTSKAFGEAHIGVGDADSCLCDQPAKGRSLLVSATQNDGGDCCNERLPKEHWSHSLRRRQAQTAVTVPGRRVQDLLAHREAKVIVHCRYY